ncbi:hypothetical protein V8C37DRAFT_405656 [Trichoderma ceciliae]
MHLDDCENGKISLNRRCDKFQVSWQLKALLAGRIPLPASRPRRIVDEFENAESSEANCILGEDERSVKDGDRLHNEDEQEISITVHTAKRPKPDKLKTGRKQWKLAEIRRVITMRKSKMTWEQILEHFPDRTIVGIRQIFWKYSSTYGIY